MLIGIDGNEANVKNRVGVNRYSFDLLCSIYELQKKQAKKANPIRFTVFLKNTPLPDLPKETSWWKYKVLPGRGMWILTRLMSHLFLTKEKPNVFFSPNHYVPIFSPMPKICSIMDLGYLNFSGQFKKYDFWQLKYWTAISLCISKHIIAISNSTKSDIVRHYPSTAKKITVTYLGYDKTKFHKNIPPKDVRRVKNRHSIVGDYILFLSTLKPSKNIEGLLEAFSELKGVKLVIAGKKGWLYEPIFNKVKELGLQKDVIFTDFVPEEDKPALIKGAKVFVLPSYWEGFGLDPLYAMACGVPVVVSNKGSLPEVVGDAGLLVNPEKPADIAKKIKEVLSMSKIEYNKVVERGFAQADKFSWEKTAKKTLDILVKTANTNKS